MKCKKCEIDKELKDFYARCKTCKKCTIDRVCNYQKNEGLEVHRSANRKYMSSKKGTVVSARAMAIYSNKNNKKIQAKNSVRKAIKKGLIIRKPCEVCGAHNSHAHHDDYDYPLMVRFLCAVHHKQWHAKYGEGKNG